MKMKKNLGKIFAGKKLIIGAVGTTMIAVVLLLLIINPFRGGKVKGIETETQPTTTAIVVEETTEIQIEDIGVNEKTEEDFELNGNTWYGRALGATIAIEKDGIPEGTILIARNYNLDESPVGAILKKDPRFTSIYGLYDFQLFNKDEKISVVQGKSITLMLPVPEGASEFLALCHIDPETEAIEYYKGTIQDGYISFNLRHFSFYGMVEMSEADYRQQFGMPEVEEPVVAKKEMNKVENVVAEAPPEPIAEPEIFEVTGMVHGIDVSRWQGNIDWGKVKASGISFVMIKACGVEYGAGGLYTDRYFTQNIEGALAAGLQVGVYAFSDVVELQDNLNLADKVVELVRPYKLTYPIVFDFEGSSRTPSISKTNLTNLAIAFCDRISEAGHTPMVYGNPNYFKNKYNIGNLSSRYKIWLACYYQGYYYGNTYDGHRYKNDIFPDLPYPFQMWQYTSQGRVPGINGYVDMNIAFFSYSGTNVSTSTLELNQTKTNYIGNINGNAPNLLEGVTAKDTRGEDVSSKVTYKLFNSSNQEKSLGDAMKVSGTYTIQYTIIDFTGGKLTKTATLKVRALPELSGVASTYTGTTEDTLAQLYERVRSGVQAVNKNNDGNTVSYTSTVTNSKGNVVIDSSKAGSSEKLEAGTYTIKYIVTDTHATFGEIKIEVTRNLVISAPVETTTIQETSTNP